MPAQMGEGVDDPLRSPTDPAVDESDLPVLLEEGEGVDGIAECRNAIDPRCKQDSRWGHADRLRRE
jgi:hypothetical protein